MQRQDATATTTTTTAASLEHLCVEHILRCLPSVRQLVALVPDHLLGHILALRVARRLGGLHAKMVRDMQDYRYVFHSHGGQAAAFGDLAA
jgi:hypothetical protein